MAALSLPPTVDISPFRAAGRDQPLPPSALAVVEEWRLAFAEGAGVAHIVGHGIDDGLIAAACDAAREFFCRSTEAEKHRVAKDAARDGGNRGYRPPGVGSVSATWSRADGTPLADAPVARPPDLVEQYELLCDELDPVPPHQPGFLPALHAYHDAGVSLSKTLMELTACALGLPREHFAEAFGAPSELNRLHAAFSPPGLARGSSEALRRGEHTDFEALTILYHESSGLQVQLPDDSGGQWIDAPPVAGGLTVNAGDLLQLWTNDELRTCVHRVANERGDGDGDGDGRLSLVLFTGPSPSTLIEPLPTCVGAEGERHYMPIVAADHVTRKLKASGNLTPVVSAVPAAGASRDSAAAAAPDSSSRRRLHRHLQHHLRSLGSAGAAAAPEEAIDPDPSPGPASSNNEVLDSHASRLSSAERQQELDAAVQVHGKMK